MHYGRAIRHQCLDAGSSDPIRAQRACIYYRGMFSCVSEAIWLLSTDHAQMPLGRDGYATITTTFYRRPDTVPLTVNLPSGQMGALRPPRDARRRGENYLDLDGDGRPPPPYRPADQPPRESSRRPPSQTGSRNSSMGPPPPPPSSARGSPFASTRGRANTPGPGPRGRRADVPPAEQVNPRPSQGNVRPVRALDWAALNIRPPVRVSPSLAPRGASGRASAGTPAHQGSGTSSSATQGVTNPVRTMVLYGHDFSSPAPPSRPASQGPPCARPGHSRSTSRSSSGHGGRTSAPASAQPPSAPIVHPVARTRANLAADAAVRRMLLQRN